MGQFSTEIYILPGSTLSGNQQLKVTPHRIDDKVVALDLELERDAFMPGSAPGSFQEAILVEKTTLTTSAQIELEHTVVLGGLSRQTEENIRSGVPILSSLPGLQYLFGTTAHERTHTSVLLLVTPRPGHRAVERADLFLESETGKPLHHAPTADAIRKHLHTGNRLYRQFRRGDLDIGRWNSASGVRNHIEDIMTSLIW